MRKRIIALLLALILTVGLLPTVALAADPTAPTDETPGEDAVSFTKEVVGDKIKIEAYVNGDVETSVTTTPCDIVLVLDQSGSMADKIKAPGYKYTEVSGNWSYSIVNSGNYYYHCSRCGDYHEVEAKWNYDYGGTYYYLVYDCPYNYNWDMLYNGSEWWRWDADDTIYTGTLYTRTETPGSDKTKVEALKEAANTFLQVVSESATSNKVNHRVSIVGFGSAGIWYTNTEVLSVKGSYSSYQENGSRKHIGQQYSSYGKNRYKNSLVAINSGTSINPMLTNAVKAVEADGATAVDLGLDMASRVFSNQDAATQEEYTDGTRAKIVVVVTDGIPTHSSGLETKVASTAINTAGNLEKNGAKVFAVGIALDTVKETKPGDGSTPTNAKNFISWVSSDYPDATSWNNHGAQITGAPKYGIEVSTADSLKSIFADIAKESTNVSASAKLTSTAIMSDTLSDYFNLPANADTSKIEVYTSAASYNNGTLTWGDETPYSATVTISTNKKTITVTGFDYSANCVTKKAKDAAGTDFGKKLVIYIPIEKDATKAQFGGYLPTNDDATLNDPKGDKEGYKADGAHKDCTVVAPTLKGINKQIDAGSSYSTTDLFTGSQWPDGSNNAGVDMVYTIEDSTGATVATKTVPAGKNSAEVDWVFATGKQNNNTYPTPGTYTFKLGCTVSCTNPEETTKHTAASTTVTGTITVKRTTATVTLTKTITGLSAEDAATVRNNLKIYAKDSSDAQHELTKNTTTGIYSAELAAGTYTIVETGKDVTGYDCATSGDTTFTVVADTDKSLALTNAYTAKKYSITYEYTGTVPDGAAAQLPPPVSDVAYKSEQTVDNVPTLPGYSFVGWTSEQVTPDASGKFTMPNKDVVFKGSWTEKDKVTIKYVAKDGGTVTLANETLNPDTGEATGSTATAEPNYRFVGWYDNADCMGTALSTQTAFTPTKPEGGWVTTTYYAKFEQIQVNVNLSPYVKKTLEVDGTLPTGFSETFKVNVTVDEQLLQQQGTVTMTAAGTSNFTMPTVTLTCGVHTIVVQEVVDLQTKNSNIAYGINPESFVLNVTASGVQYGSTDSEGTFVPVTGSPFVTITNKYTQPTETFDLNTLITKNFEARTDSKPIPNGNYTFTAQIFEADDKWQQVGKSPVYTGTATLNGAASGAAFDFDSSSNPTLASGTHRYLVKEEHGGETIDGITYDSTVYRLTITVSEDGTQPNVQIEAVPQASVLSVQSVAFDKTITFTNTYFEEKDPNKCTIDFSKFVKKELTATGSKTVDEATFIVDVVGSYDGEAIANALPPTEMQATTDEDVLNTTLTASIKNIVGGNVYEEPFTGSVTVSKPGHYTFTLTERKGTQSGVTYDEAHYQVFVNIMRVGDNLVIHDATTYLNNEQVELIKLVNDVPVTAGYIVFKNTIDTGKDDYYPIIIPAIINKDTGMLNKTDHFAYVIGYPDGTVHPNGQITRAEVATIFFRLLRDEVRDGAFTTSNSYSDVAYGKWYNNPISTMSALGIITGYPDGTFKPNKPITRAEFAAIAARFDETQSGKSATFSDVIGHWAAKEIGIAYYNDWIKGYPDGTFKPDQNITRAEAMTLINRVLERKPESPADLLTNMNKWTDNMDTSKWYYLDVQEATNSHGYTRKTFNYELWRQMLPDPDWSRYER